METVQRQPGPDQKLLTNDFLSNVIHFLTETTLWVRVGDISPGEAVWDTQTCEVFSNLLPKVP